MENEFELQQPAPQQEPEPATYKETPEAPVTPEPEQPPVFAPRFEPSGEYRWVPNPEAVAPQKVKKPKKPGKGKKVLSGIIVTLLVLGLSLAAGYTGAHLDQWLSGGRTGKPAVQSDDENEKDSDTPKDPEQDSDKVSNILMGNREDTTIQINQVDTSKQMTPAEVYAVNVNATVGITTSITTTNYWGYPTTSAASGSGFVYSDDGYILTNFHVIEDSNSITVTTYDGRSLDAKLIGYDKSNDIAVLKVEEEDLTPVIIGNSDNLNVGDPVVAIGNPLGELTFSLTSGAVSALEREVTFSDGNTMNLIQTDCAINSGNSGGALFNLYGEVIGVTNAKYSGNSASGASIDNIGFAIPINSVLNIINSIIENGYVIKPYIGVSITDVSAEAQSYGLPKGASVRSIEEDSPAEKAGLQENDIITHVNGEEITGSADLKKFVTQSAPGDQLELKVWRNSKTIDVTVTVGENIQNDFTMEKNQ